MEFSHDILKICGCLDPKMGFYTLHTAELPKAQPTIRVNCNNEYFIEIVLDASRRTVGDRLDASRRTKLAMDYETVKRMTEVASYGNVIVDDGLFRMQSGRLYAECPIGFASGEELCPPPIDERIPFVNVSREHLRKAFNIINVASSVDRVRLYLDTAKPYPSTRSVDTAKPYPAEGARSVDTAKPYPAEGARSAKRELIIQKAGVRITLSCECGEAVDGAYLEFESETIERIVCFLGLLHHEYVKLHIHKDLIFRIVAGSADLRSVIQSKTVITFYCGHCV
jgi:hypothetical protein